MFPFNKYVLWHKNELLAVKGFSSLFVQINTVSLNINVRAMYS